MINILKVFSFIWRMQTAHRYIFIFHWHTNLNWDYIHRFIICGLFLFVCFTSNKRPPNSRRRRHSLVCITTIEDHVIFYQKRFFPLLSFADAGALYGCCGGPLNTLMWCSNLDFVPSTFECWTFRFRISALLWEHNVFMKLLRRMVSSIRSSSLAIAFKIKFASALHIHTSVALHSYTWRLDILFELHRR